MVDDSPLSLELLRRLLAGDPEINLVGTAHNGHEALTKLVQLVPDVLCTDLHMPGMDGVTLTREVMRRHPLPILVMSTSLQESQKDNIFAMLEAGAVDILAKPLGGLDNDYAKMARDLILKIKVLSGVKVVKRYGSQTVPPPPIGQQPIDLPELQGKTPKVICIGASTGGPQALDQILKALPRNFPLPIVCIQHIATGFMQGMVDWLSCICKIKVRTARTGMRPEPGTTYFPEDDHHLEIDQDGLFRSSLSPTVSDHRPSIDLAMRSFARHYRDRVAGILLTGMGKDGAEGLLEISRAGGLTIAQDEATSVVFGMPRWAAEIGAARIILPLSQIAPTLLRLTGGKTV
jgi:two-component system chemotaxis response regulator CheB